MSKRTKRKYDNPSKYRQLNFTIHADLKERLDAICERRGITKTEFIQEAIAAALAREELRQ